MPVQLTTPAIINNVSFPVCKFLSNWCWLCTIYEAGWMTSTWLCLCFGRLSLSGFQIPSAHVQVKHFSRCYLLSSLSKSSLASNTIILCKERDFSRIQFFFLSCSAYSQKFSVTMKRWKPTLLLSSLPTVISFVWPSLNKKSKQMHVKDPFLTSSLLFCPFPLMFIKK